MDSCSSLHWFEVMTSNKYARCFKWRVNTSQSQLHTTPYIIKQDLKCILNNNLPIYHAFIKVYVLSNIMCTPLSTHFELLCINI